MPANRLLLAASLTGDTVLVDELLKAKADPTINDTNGLTALHHAAFSQAAVGARNGVIKMLLKGGAEPNHRSLDLGTPLHIAMRQGASDVASLLLSRYAPNPCLTLFPVLTAIGAAH